MTNSNILFWDVIPQARQKRKYLSPIQPSFIEHLICSQQSPNGGRKTSRWPSHLQEQPILMANVYQELTRWQEVLPGLLILLSPTLQCVNFHFHLQESWKSS